jgi:hypothetical protein
MAAPGEIYPSNIHARSIGRLDGIEGSLDTAQERGKKHQL